ncbi:hypothetical protein BJ742DRAFT_295151 [Cladochytrium replicatum]|nr:hypothetical protein BJ742DRAFT_295151 [Cladochytrium replicatum]
MDVLRDPYFIYPFIISAFIQIFTYYFLQHAFPKQFAQTRKQKAWILTLQNSFVTALSSVPFLYHFAANGFSFDDFPAIDTPFAKALTAFFMTYLLADLTFGALFYPELMDPMTGWFHHTLYTVLSFQILRWGVPGLLGVYLILEAPTLLLSMGQINKAFRKDMLYGGIFFSTRIVFHLVLSYKLFTDFHNFLFLPTVSVFPIHILWFKQWIVQQIKKCAIGTAPTSKTQTVKEWEKVVVASGSSVPVPRRAHFIRADSVSSAAVAAAVAASLAAPPTPPKPKRRILGVMAAAQQPAMARLQAHALRLLRGGRRGSNSNLQS